MTGMGDVDRNVTLAAAAIREADALLIGAGAGMGVDSGLPDFRGDTGFWKAYPPFRGRRFDEISNPRWFRADPEQAWGFFGHRLNLYRTTVPHAGFGIVRLWAEEKPCGYFVFTSNVDGHFQVAGFPEDRVVECHGSIRFLQCSAACSSEIWPADELAVAVDEETIRATSPLARCVRCAAVARPNVLMFGDSQWVERRCAEQEQRYATWLRKITGRRLAVLEIGAGLAVPTVRWECERAGGTLIRVNPRDSEVPVGGVSIALGALDAMLRVDRELRG